MKVLNKLNLKNNLSISLLLIIGDFKLYIIRKPLFSSLF